MLESAGLFHGEVTNAGCVCLRIHGADALHCSHGAVSPCFASDMTAPRRSEAATIFTKSRTMKWICCQLGAREHYAIPRALSRLDALDWLITDAWVPPSSFLAKSDAKTRERFHAELRDARVRAFSSSLILFETFARARGLQMWPSILARNRWFQRKVVKALSLLARRSLGEGC